jgi:hypothetical protein
MPSWKKVIVSGSDATLNSLLVSNGITGSILGTATTASNITPAITNDADTRIITANGNGTLNAESLLTFDGTKLSVLYQSGDEGGEILLNKPVTNTTIAGTGVTVDIYQNKLRFFEQGGSARGYYLDITTGGAGAATNLASGGGTVTSVGGQGSVSGITLTGTVTASGSLTLGGSISGLTNSNLSGTAGITNANLANSSVTVGSTAIALGASATTIAGLSSVTSTTFVGALTGNASTATQTTATVTGTNSADLVYGNMADNDQFRIRVGGTATNAGFVEIATADDGTEPIHVRQYTGVFASLARTATLLDGSGNTSFPGTVTANGTLLTGNAGTVTSVATAGSVNGITLTGGFSTSGTLTLGGTLSGIGNAQLTNSAITIAGTSTSLGGSITQATILAGSGVFSGSAQIPNSSIANAQLANSTISGVALGSTLAALTAGSYLTSAGTYTGNTARTFAVDATDANTANKVVARDASGNFSAGTITATLSGNASTATSAATLTTARSINGTSFNGSADITTANWGTTRTITIGATGKSVNGSGNVAWSLAEIGAQAALTDPVTGSGTVSYIPKFTSGTAIGNSQIFDNGTNVGIGTTSPNGKLQVNGNAYFGTFLNTDIRYSFVSSGALSSYHTYINNTNSAGGTYGLGVNNNNTSSNGYILGLSSGGTERMIVRNDGNVGIGITSPAYKLDVTAASTSDGLRINLGGTSKIIANGDGVLAWGASADQGVLTWDTGKAIVMGQAGDALSLGANGTWDRLYINTSGDVGIGTTSPNSKLHVVGNTSITGSTVISGSLLVRDGLGTVLDTANYALVDGGVNSVHWGNRELKDTNNVATVDWENLTLSSPSGQINVDWGAGYTKDSADKFSIDWQTRQLLDSTQNLAVDWLSRRLYNSAGSNVLDWESATFTGNADTATNAGYASTAGSAGYANLAGGVGQSITFNSGGGGGASGTAYDGSIARTISYNSIGAPSATGANASGTWGISITGNAGTATSATSAGTAGSVTNAVTFDNGGAGNASGTTFNGSAARTISYNSIGAPSTTGTNASGTWNINITGSSDFSNRANNISITDDTAGAYTCYPLFTKDATGFAQARIDSPALTYRPDTNTLTAGTFSGTLSGAATQIQTISNNSGTTHYVTMVDNHNGTLTAEQLRTQASLTVTPSNGDVGVGGRLTMSGGVITNRYVAHGSGTTAMAFGSYGVVRVVPNATATYTTTVPAAGTLGTLIVVTSGTTSYTITFGTGFKTTATLVTGTVSARTFTLSFVSDGTNVIETSRTIAMA